MKDIHAAELIVDSGADYVWLGRRAPADTLMSYSGLTPKKARKLARKLLDEADAVEGIERVERDEPFCWLALGEDEAKTLAVILARVGGTAGGLGTPITARKYADAVYHALTEIGLNGSDIGGTDPRFTVDPRAAAIYFLGVAE